MELSVRFLDADPGRKGNPQAPALCQSKGKSHGGFAEKLQLPIEYITDTTLERPQACKPVGFELESQLYNLLAELYPLFVVTEKCVNLH